MTPIHWSKVNINPRNVTLDPAMLYGMTRFMKVNNGDGFKQRLILFDKDFVVWYLDSFLRKLLPAEEKIVRDILSEVLKLYEEEYLKCLSNEVESYKEGYTSQE
ncbi:MAG: hypothetical protein ABWU13_13585 [Limnospira maxima]